MGIVIDVLYVCMCVWQLYMIHLYTSIYIDNETKYGAHNHQSLIADTVLHIELTIINSQTLITSSWQCTSWNLVYTATNIHIVSTYVYALNIMLLGNILTWEFVSVGRCLSFTVSLLKPLEISRRSVGHSVSCVRCIAGGDVGDFPVTTSTTIG